MKISLAIAFGCLLLAIAAICLSESRVFRRSREKVGAVLVWGVLLCCYGVCVGLAAAVLGYCFDLREWVALAIAAPLGLPLLIFACLMAEG